MDGQGFPETLVYPIPLVKGGLTRFLIESLGLILVFKEQPGEDSLPRSLPRPMSAEPFFTQTRLFHNPFDGPA